MLKWFITVGVPGGEYAFRCTDDEWNEGKYSLSLWVLKGMTNTRPAPPDLVEWIEAEMHKSQLDEINCCRYKTPGGWIYFDCATQGVCFIPVALAAGLTVIAEVKSDE